MLMARRTWKRDGSENVMRLDVAAENLHYNCVNLTIRKRSRQQIEEMLEGGLRLETPLATFDTVRESWPSSKGG
jgi:hypothetical protein